jgi:hypothetical protein
MGPLVLIAEELMPPRRVPGVCANSPRDFPFIHKNLVHPTNLILKVQICRTA